MSWNRFVISSGCVFCIAKENPIGFHRARDLGVVWCMFLRSELERHGARALGVVNDALRSHHQAEIP